MHGPTCLILGLYAIYRSSFAAIFGYDRFQTLATLSELLHSPLLQLRNLIQVALQDMVYVLLSQWYAAVEPSLIDLTRPSTILILASMLGFAASHMLSCSQIERRQGGELRIAQSHMSSSGPAWWLSCCPCFPSGSQASPSIRRINCGANDLLWPRCRAQACLVVGAVFVLVERVAYRHALLSLLLGVGGGTSRADCTRLSSVLGQAARPLLAAELAGAFPQGEHDAGLGPGDLVLHGHLPDGLCHQSAVPTGHGAPATRATGSTRASSTWTSIDSPRARRTPSRSTARVFTANPDEIVSITFEPGLGQCLWVLRPELRNAGGLTTAARTWLELSNPSRIQLTPAEDPPVAHLWSGASTLLVLLL